MSKARIPAVPIQFGGKSRLLIFDYNALAELQDLAGTYQSNQAHLKSMRAIVWAGLLAETLDDRGRETPLTLSLKQVGDILQEMEPAELESLSKAIMEARGISDPEPDPPQASETPTPQV